MSGGENALSSWRNWVREQRLRRGAPEPEIAAADEVLDPAALAFGFARRCGHVKARDAHCARLSAAATNSERWPPPDPVVVAAAMGQKAIAQKRCPVPYADRASPKISAFPMRCSEFSAWSGIS